MIIAHLADLHLGFRAYSRVTPTGVNQREADVAAAFAEAVESVVDLRPDLVLVAGDVFHSVRPSNGAIATAFRTFSSLSSRLAATPIVVIGGERDTPRAADTITILDLFREIPRVHVVADRAEHLRLAEIDAEVLAVPHAALAGGRPPRLKPGSGPAGVRVLLAHGQLSGARAEGIAGGAVAEGGAALDAAAIDFGEWDYVALGHHPRRLQVAENAWYAGSLEWTSANPWEEAAASNATAQSTGGAERARAEKGFISFDTASRAASFHPVSTREVVDLPRISARALPAAEVDAAIATVLEGVPGSIAGKIVRLVISDITRAELRQLDHEALRWPRAEALHFLLDPRAPVRDAPSVAPLAARGVSLERQVEEYLSSLWDPTMEGIDPSRLAALAEGYLARAREAAES